MEAQLLAPTRAWTLLQDGHVQLVDLRGRNERGLPQIPGARAIPLEELAHELTTLDRERPLVLVSGTGRKAAEAMDVLRSAGVTASAVEGGMQAWLEAGLPTETATPPDQADP